MKLYTFPKAPNAIRVHIFLAEKSLDIPTEIVDVMGKETRREPFLSKNSLGEIPVLELDDGMLITESVAICRYIEELHPEPRLMGGTPVEAARVEMWSRRMEQQIMGPLARYGLHTIDIFTDKIEQIPAYAESQARLSLKSWEWLDAELSDGRTFVCDDRFSIADITGIAALYISDFTGLAVPDGLVNVKRWEAAVRARPTWERKAA